MTTRRLVVTLVAVALMLTALANVAVAAPQNAPQNAPQASYTCVAYHTVRFGDTLNSISRLYGVSVQALMAANNIYNANLIFAGQSLCIPGSAPVPPPPPPPPPGNVPPPASCGTYYTVRFGDTLTSIAARYRTTVQAIMYANNIPNANFIYAGMILYVPCGTKPPASAPSYSQWKGEYFNNQNLAGAPSVVRNDPNIAFNWGLGWPNPKIAADHFSVRWTRTVKLNQGTYRFSVRTDDGARLFVDNVLVIDQWHTASGETYVVDVPLGAGNHVVRMEYFEDTGNAYAYLTYAWVSGPGSSATPMPPIPPTPGPGTGGSAWTCTYFANQALDNSVAVVILPDLLLNWGGASPYPGVPKTLWSMRCTSVQYMPSNGLYQFNAQVDDGVRLFVDGNAVINAWTDHAGTTQVGTANLNAGPHNVTVEYYQFGHDSMLSVWWNKK